MTPPLPLSVGDAARTEGGRLALIASSGEAWTYTRLAQEVAAASEALQARGVRPQDRVVIAPDRQVSSVVTLHAIFELGATAVLLQPSWTAYECAAALKSVPDAYRLDESPLKWECGEAIPAPRLPHDLRYPMVIAFTSGTTGESRGVVISRGAWVSAAHASAANLGWRPEDRWLLCMPPAHVGGLSILIRTLMGRRAVALYDAPSFDVSCVRDFMERSEVTLASMVPTMLERLLRDEAWVPPASLRVLLLGGAGCAEALLRRAVQRGVHVRTTYGLTETCGQVTTQTEAREITELGDAGTPLCGWEVSIRDGEIRVRGGALFDGYLHAQGFVAAKLDDHGWWSTQDLGDFDDAGRLRVRGRRDALIISGGENVYTAEVEGALNALSEVEECCVFGLEDAEWGQVVAAVVVLTHAGGDLQSVQRKVIGLLAPHKRPKAWAVASELIRTSSGKVRRAHVAAAFRDALQRV